MNNIKFKVSRIEYRVNPARPERSIPLGLLLLTEFKGRHLIAACVRCDPLTDAELQGVDRIGQELLKDLSGFVKREVESGLKECTDPCQILDHLAETRIWSFHITAPEEMVAPFPEPQPECSGRKIAIPLSAPRHLQATWDQAIARAGVLNCWGDFVHPSLWPAPPVVLENDSGQTC